MKQLNEGTKNFKKVFNFKETREKNSKHALFT